MTPALWSARLLALAGFVDAAYLTAHHYSGLGVACGPGGGCEAVLTSGYAEVAGIPVALAGLAYYVAASLIAWTPRAAWNRRTAVALLGLESVALAVSATLVWIQAVRIGSWCRFCLVSAILTLLLFLVSLWLFRATPPATTRSLP